ncbi:MULTISPECIES: SusC/RagA family TonB-linked outer membrane protein [Niastella]|uniref:SusC/RagA family TonB-linked outer membrane protein n=1 Tax=Niastella soli TaxID=2821487 RepID=A0ABS3YY15_9BACT|nr:SusC/RagA family TonB-linked outer membrane protein [Niastella soli]MBO9202814.1 SusC/RagA family TonB-linked outer membrane protein [Niastella soli]
MQDYAACKVPFFDGTKPKLFPLKGAIRKILLVMRITAMLLLAATLQVSAKSWSQEKITLSVTNAPMEQVFNSITAQTGLSFLYRPEYVRGKTVTINVANATLKAVMEICLKEQQLNYTVVGKIVGVHPVKSSGKIGELQSQQQIDQGDIKGRVLTKEGEPLVSANVVNKRTGKGTITDANGGFLLHDCNLNDIIVISYTGFAPRNIKISEFITLTLVMEPAINQLDQVVMQAYGTTTQRLSTGSIAKVTAEEISKQPVVNPLQALQGKVPGLIISQTNGYASAPFKVEIRGRNNINGIFSGEPLFVIDGVPLTIMEITDNPDNYSIGSKGLIQNGFVGPALGQSPFFNINPSDIESIEILKDADATSIYGSRGSNGVILVTTKKGKAGKSKLDVNANLGISEVSRYWDMLDTKQYLQMRREAFTNAGQNMTAGNAFDLLVWDTTRYTDWQRAIWGGTGKNVNIQTSLSGGDSRTSFRIGVGYNRITNILTTSGADQRGAFSFNVNHKNANQKLTISLTGNYTVTQSGMVNVSINAVTLPPNAPPILDLSGKPNYQGWAPFRSQYPFAGLFQPYSAKTHLLTSNLTIGYEIIKGLSVKGSFGFNNAQNAQESFEPISSQDPKISPLGNASFGNNVNRNWIIEPQIEYSSFWSKGKINVLVGGSKQENITKGDYFSGSGYTTDALLHTISNAPTRFASSNYGQYKYAAIFARVNYNWENKYLLNLSARRDGSSTFGPGKQFGNFGSIGVGWIFSEEQLIKRIKFLNFGKLRGSYGTTGGEGPSYGYLTRWQIQDQNYSDISPLAPIQHYNPDYRWQVNRKIEAALELGLFKDRINLLISWYRNRCDNQLVAVPIPDFTGFSDVTSNSPALVENSGWEYSANIKIVEAKEFKWSVSINAGFNKNKLISYPGFELSPYASTLAIGYPLNIRKLLHYTGVDPETGKYTFEDKNKDGSVRNNSSDYFIYDVSPKCSGGLGNILSYKGLSLSLFFNFTKQTGRNALAGLLAGSMANMPTLVLQRWRKQGDITNVARFTSIQRSEDIFFKGFSDGIYTDASFVRLQNASISYSLPKSVIKKAGLQNCNIYLQAQNLFVITNYKGIDPETQNFGGMPPSRVVVGGISFSF